MIFQCFRVKVGTSNESNVLTTTQTLQSKKIPYPIFKQNRSGHLYVIKEREFIKTKENIFKIGKTINIVNRMPQYPKQSRVYIMFYSTNIDDMEKYIIEQFDKRFTKRVDIGAEYYECDQNELLMDMSVFMLHVFSNFKNIKED